MIFIKFLKLLFNSSSNFGNIIFLIPSLTAVRLGIKNIILPKLEEELNNNFKNLINIKEISNIREAVDYSLSK